MNEATKYLKIKDFNFGSGGFSAKHREASLSGVLSASRKNSDAEKTGDQIQTVFGREVQKQTQ